MECLHGWLLIEEEAEKTRWPLSNHLGIILLECLNCVPAGLLKSVLDRLSVFGHLIV